MYTDAYMALKVAVKTEIYQLIGVVCLGLAMKYDEDTLAFSLNDLRVLCDDQYRLDELRDMEWDVFESLKWTLGVTSVFERVVAHSYLRADISETDLMKMLVLCDFVHIDKTLMCFDQCTIVQSIIGHDFTVSYTPGASCRLLKWRAESNVYQDHKWSPGGSVNLVPLYNFEDLYDDCQCLMRGQ
jgi:hypothetical protein